jgi:Uma2 family endonuclease
MAVAERELITPAPETEEQWTPQPYRWTREQFYQMGDLGLFEGRRAILVEGEILAMPAMGNTHRHILTLASDVLRDLFGSGFFVSAQCPFDIGRATDPEPDIAIIRGSLGDYRGRGLTEAALIVEVSDTTLAYDRSGKASLYAMAGVTDYWIINIDQEPGQIEVHRQPVPDEAQPFSFGYREKTVHRAGEIIQPLASPKPVAVSALLP